MNRIRHIRRLTIAMAGLACAWLGIASAAPAAFAAAGRFQPPGGEAGTAVLRAPLAAHIHQPAPQTLGPVLVHTVAAGRHARLADRPDRHRGRAVRGHGRCAAGPRPHHPAPPVHRGCLSPSAAVASASNTTARSTTCPNIMDFHQDLKLPAEAIAQIAEDARHARADQFGVRQIELYHNDDAQVYCLLDGPDEQAIRAHHAALGVPCGDVHQVDSLT